MNDANLEYIGLCGVAPSQRVSVPPAGNDTERRLPPPMALRQVGIMRAGNVTLTSLVILAAALGQHHHADPAQAGHRLTDVSHCLSDTHHLLH
jgi:hypothetical protein